MSFVFETMIIYPAIDLRKGRVVRLEQGRADAETVYFEDPAQPANDWKVAGAEWIHVVDLDGAFAGEGLNRSAVDKIVATGVKVQLGGGMRSMEAVKSALDAGVARVVIGTRAAEEPGFIGDLIQAFGPDRIAVGIDAKDGLVAIKGWVETLNIEAIDLAQTVEAMGCETIIYTDISRDGMLTGPNLDAQRSMLESAECNIIASGGVSYPKDLTALRELKTQCPNLDGVITGKAIYEGRIDLAAEFKAGS